MDALLCDFQNTITNADKLLAAADELAQTGECDPKEIYGEAHELEQRMHNFLSALERRRDVLDMTVAFYTHVHEVSGSGCFLTHEKCVLCSDLCKTGQPNVCMWQKL